MSPPTFARFVLVLGLALALACAACAPAPPTGSGAAPPAAAPPAAAREAASPAPPASAAPAPSSQAAAPTLAPLDPPVDVRVRVGSSLTTAPFYYALDKGYFRELGINYVEVQIANSAEVTAALLTGELDFAGTAFGPGIYNAIKREIPIVAVADNGQLNRGLAGSAAVVKAGQLANYSSWCDLRGKRVGIVSRSTGLYVTLAKALRDQCGLGPEAVEWVEIPFGDTSQAVHNGAVDMALHIEPFVSRGLRDGVLEIFRTADDAYLDQQMNIIVAAPSMAARREVGLRVLVAYLKGARDYNAAIRQGVNREEYKQTMARHLAIKDPEAYETMIPMGIDLNGRINRASVRESLEIYRDVGMIPTAGDIDLSWIDESLLDEALRIVGTVQ